MMSDEFRRSADNHQSSFTSQQLIFPLVVIDPVLWPADSTVTAIVAPDMPERRTAELPRK